MVKVRRVDLNEMSGRIQTGDLVLLEKTRLVFGRESPHFFTDRAVNAVTADDDVAGVK